MRLQPTALVLALALASAGLAACSGVDYRDSNAGVDVDPLCVSRADRPGEPVASNCVRRGEATISTERPAQPVDFRRQRDD